MLKNILRKIWHDPVGSAVIAGIILGLPSTIAYIISLSTKNLFLVFGVGIVVLFFCILTFITYKNSTGIALDFEKGIISASCTNDKINHISNFCILGKNKSNKKPILKVSGHLRSRLTNEIFPIYFNVNGNLVSPQNTNGIPAGASFEIIVPFVKDEKNEFIKGENGKWNPNHGVGLGYFLSNLESSTLTIELDGWSHTYNISAKITQKNTQEIQKMISPPIEPRITQKGKS